jgi:hypothetical protein
VNSEQCDGISGEEGSDIFSGGCLWLLGNSSGDPVQAPKCIKKVIEKYIFIYL